MTCRATYARRPPTRPRLALVHGSSAPAVQSLPTPRAVPDSIQTDAENIRGRIAWALMPLTSKVSTDVALGRSKAELFAIATALQKLARRL